MHEKKESQGFADYPSLLLPIAIIAIILGMAIPAFQKARAHAKVLHEQTRRVAQPNLITQTNLQKEIK